MENQKLNSRLTIAGIFVGAIVTILGVWISNYGAWQNRACEMKANVANEIIDLMADQKNLIEYKIGVPDVCYQNDGTIKGKTFTPYRPQTTKEKDGLIELSATTGKLVSKIAFLLTIITRDDIPAEQLSGSGFLSLPNLQRYIKTQEEFAAICTRNPVEPIYHSTWRRLQSDYSQSILEMSGLIRKCMTAIDPFQVFLSALAGIALGFGSLFIMKRMSKAIQHFLKLI